MSGTNLKRGFVYFLRAESTGLVKIGFSTSPSRRLLHHQISNAERLTIVALFPGTRADEAAEHRRFSADRGQGEWFRPTVALLERIAELSTERLHCHAEAA